VDWDADKEKGLDCTYGTSAKDYCGVRYFMGQGPQLYRNLVKERLTVEDLTFRYGGRGEGMMGNSASAATHGFRNRLTSATSPSTSSEPIPTPR
jgi:hypothetical protein